MVCSRLWGVLFRAVAQHKKLYPKRTCGDPDPKPNPQESGCPAVGYANNPEPHTTPWPTWLEGSGSDFTWGRGAWAGDLRPLQNLVAQTTSPTPKSLCRIQTIPVATGNHVLISMGVCDRHRNISSHCGVGEVLGFSPNPPSLPTTKSQ